MAQVHPVNYSLNASADIEQFNISSLSTTDFDMESFRVVITTLFILVCVCGLLGNGLVIVILLRFSDMRTVPNVFILNLASSDFLFMLGIPFLLQYNMQGQWIFGNGMCKIVQCIDYINMFTGIFTLTVMSCDRYLALVYPLRSMSLRTVKHARITCIILWIISIPLTLPLWLYSTVSHITDEFNQPKTECETNWPNDYINHVFFIFAFVVGFALPILLISLCHVGILRHVVCMKNKADLGRHFPQFSMKITMIILLALLAFAVCWLPYWVLILLRAIGNQKVTLEYYVVFNISLCLSYFNSCLNPLIYTCVGRDFQEKMSRFFHCSRGADINSRMTTTGDMRITKL
ncbi:somatostatin receptor type 2-like [Saccoglossus kowalevskii]|uniref:Somatostatin receptor type 2-like n=1 Tax=Saccoglossus kowalevskii TaxID=10224 RepID=A0ABM0GUE1_SACKO|nr:PREDICTED: somatostatin receptor type 2-like [Saccoglossus kowalevskii]